jgi:small-conductance mechanosensitive channel
MFAILYLAGVFSEQMHSIAEVLGVASAGIAFALQEVIISIAGWLAISFGRFYKIGDRVQLSGTGREVIDIGVLPPR